MLNNKLISIIVPVYNAENHIDKCIKSILSQTYENIEIILVNDGSTDKSEEICRNYTKKDNRIKVINQKNQGPSIARNNGIKLAAGEYIQFVDSDDVIDPNMTRALISSITENKSELVICGMKIIDMSNKKLDIKEKVPPFEGTYLQNDFIKYFGKLYYSDLINSPCNKLYVAEVMKKFNIEFKENIMMGEDLLFNLEYIHICRSISVIKQRLYSYLIFNNNNSLTKKYKNDLFENQQMLFRKLREFLFIYSYYSKENKYFIETSYTTSIVSCIGNLFKGDSSLNNSEIKSKILDIVNDEQVRVSLEYFKKGNYQKRLIGFWINYTAINKIYNFFMFKKLLRDKLNVLFNIFKNLNK